MFDYIKGKLVEKTPTYAVIDCSGVGYVLHISVNTFSQIPDSEQCLLYAHLAVREDAHILYGFVNKGEREAFRMLINVSGVGASTARMILSSLSTNEIAEAVMTNNVTTLKNVKGIGEKTAQRIIIDLKGKFDHDSISPDLFVGLHNTARSEALTALTLLGFAKNVSEKALEKVLKASNSDLSVEELIKLTLKTL
ncbi:MAG: Holliday junction branch migration protein RuvA [Bacteroidia bacterium]